MRSQARAVASERAAADLHLGFAQRGTRLDTRYPAPISLRSPSNRDQSGLSLTEVQPFPRPALAYPTQCRVRRTRRDSLVPTPATPTPSNPNARFVQ
jgi:hypothetical protein